MKRTPAEKAAQDYAAVMVAQAFGLDGERTPHVAAALREAFLAGAAWRAQQAAQPGAGCCLPTFLDTE